MRDFLFALGLAAGLGAVGFVVVRSLDFDFSFPGTDEAEIVVVGEPEVFITPME